MGLLTIILKPETFTIFATLKYRLSENLLKLMFELNVRYLHFKSEISKIYSLENLEKTLIKFNCFM